MTKYTPSSPHAKDITGERFSQLVVIECVGKNSDGKLLWKCLCDCGAKAIVSGKSLRDGNTKSCGCLKNKRSAHFKNRVGERFGRLLVIEEAQAPTNLSRPATYWLCQCDCGNLAKVSSAQLSFGKTQSCGCYQRDRASQAKKTHGMSQHPLYEIWCSMIKRCTNPNAIGYKNYRGRGIVVCDEWQYDFQTFHNYVTQLLHYDEKDYSLDRIDNDGNYEPGNVRFATRSEQSHNSRRATLITYKGETKCISDWARSVGMKPSTLAARLRKNPDIENALFSPMRYKPKIILPNS